TFEYCRCPMVWIPACAGMTIWKLPETQKQLKPNRPDSRLRGNNGGGRCRLKPTYHYSASIPLGGNVSGMGRFIRKSPF
ncbi:TPA: hypothetical protein ACFN76_002074, partial [Neisseria meningitidis]